MEPKAVTLYNVIDAAGMRAQAEGHADPFAAYGARLKVLTVCRLADEAKALFREACLVWERAAGRIH